MEFNIHHKILRFLNEHKKSSYSTKDYTFPSGKIIQVQGYEPYALDELLHTFNEDEIITGSGSVLEIWYDEEGFTPFHISNVCSKE